MHFRFHTDNGLHQTANKLAKSVAMREEHDCIRDAQVGVNDIVSALYFLKQAGVDTSEIVDLKKLHDEITSLHGVLSKRLDNTDIVPLLKVDLSEVEAMLEGE
jgi:hypothetical protein